jgi:hypothetical protein
MTYEPPPSMTRYGTELERAIGRELAAGQRSRLASALVRLRRPGLVGAVALASVATVTVFLSIDSGSGGPFVAPAYASFSGSPAAPLVDVVHGEDHGVPVAFRTVTSFSWTADQLAMTVRWTKRERNRTKAQVKVWKARHAPALRPIEVNVQSAGRAGTVTYFAYERFKNRPWVVEGGTTKEHDGSMVTIRSVSPFWPNKSPMIGPFRFVQIRSGGKTLTFKVTSATGWHTIRGS